MKIKAKKILIAAVLVSVVTVSLALRINALSRYNDILNGDSAVFALMAKHIYQLKEFPAYLWMSHYAGTLTSYIGALLFVFFGVSFYTYSLTGLFLSAGWVFFVFLIAKKILDLYGFITATGVVLFPASLVLFFSLLSGGIHAENLLFGTVILFLLLRWNEESDQTNSRFYFLLGFFSGAGIWLSPGIFPFFITTLTVFLLKDKKIFLSKKIIIFIAGFLLGNLPAIIHNLYYPGATLMRLGGRFLDLNRQNLSSGNVTAALAQRLIWRFSTIPSSLARIPFLFAQLAGGLNCGLFFISAAFVLGASYAKFRRQKVIDPWLVCSICLVWIILFYAIAVGIDSPRYVLVLYAVFPFVVGKALSNLAVRSRLLFGIILISMVSSNLIGIQRAWSKKERAHYSALSRWLKSRNFYYGFSDYFTAYPVIFLSNEQVLLSPTLFSGSFSERYPVYTQRVRDAENPVYAVNTREYPAETRDLEKQFARLGVTYKKDSVEEFAVYRDLSRKVYPEELKPAEVKQSRTGE